MQSAIKLILTFFIISISIKALPRDAYVSAQNGSFVLGREPFEFIGFNAYYLQSLYTDPGKRPIIEEVFRAAQKYQIKVIRTWAFYEGDSLTNKAVILSAPYSYRSCCFDGIDYLLCLASDYGIRLILTLGNDLGDYGGATEYVKWANERLLGHFGHNDFYVNDSIKSWYKDYMRTLLNHRNRFNGVLIREDPSVFSFELINEATNTGAPAENIMNWYKEMSSSFKQIDSLHMLSTGEVGYDASERGYSNARLFYNNSIWLFNGLKGTSYLSDSGLDGIDYSSYHLYPEAWNLSIQAGDTWIKDHEKISGRYNKPSLMGEFGTKSNKLKSYAEYLRAVKKTGSRSALVWSYMPEELKSMSDAYAINEKENPDLFNLFKEYASSLRDSSTLDRKVSKSELYQNYPNPFNPSTTIEYSLKEPQRIRLELYNSIGQSIGLLDEGFKNSGRYSLTLAMNSLSLASGVYFYSMTGETLSQTKKMVLLK